MARSTLKSEERTTYKGSELIFDTIKTETQQTDSGSEGDCDHKLNEKFVYPQIDSTKPVRLLKITDVTSENVEAVLEPVSCKDLLKRKYVALSYFWGQAKTRKDTHPILVNGEVFYIRNNLLSFFMQVGTSCKGKLFYIDAICINQNDKDERGRQVQMMETLFENADWVYAWLGNPIDDQQRANINVLHAALRSESERKDRFIARDRKSLLRNREAMFGFEALLSKRYWTRYWIVQELLLAQRIMVFCGALRFDWNELERFRVVLEENQLCSTVKVDWWSVTAFEKPTTSYCQETAEDHFSSRWQHALRIMTHRHNWQRARQSRVKLSVPLYRAIHYFGDHECCDPKDKVFALLGLLEKPESDEIRPYYSKSVEVIYAKALEIGLLALQRYVEPQALREGYYPRRAYEHFADTLCDALGLCPKDVRCHTLKAFNSATFKHDFDINYKAEFRAPMLSSAKAKDAVRILEEYLMMTNGSIPREISFEFEVRYRGKRVDPVDAVKSVTAGGMPTFAAPVPYTTLRSGSW